MEEGRAVNGIFTTLPGIEIPVADIPGTLARIWETPDDGPYASPSEFRASQMNLIVHFGQATDTREAGEVFATALRFSQRYPSRIILLCPESRPRGDVLLSTKLFSECYIGKSGRDRSCCESIALSYPVEEREYLENQVSILLETDLPTQYWVHRFHSLEKVTDYSFFLNIAKRVVFDSACETDGEHAVHWPRPETVRDLAFARLLPVRQSIGQFLSRFAPQELVNGLTSVEVEADRSLEAEARCLRSWIEDRLKACTPPEKPLRINSRSRIRKTGSQHCSVRLHYSDDRYFHWQTHPESETADIDANLGSVRIRLPISFKFLRPENALAEALFF